MWVLQHGGKLTVQLAGSESPLELDVATPIPKDPFSILEISLHDAKGISDSDLRNVAGLNSLKVLDLFGNPVTDAALVHLRGLGNLKELNLAATKVTGAGLANLRGCRKLEKLYLGGAPFTDEGLMQLEGMDNLTFLGLHYTKVTNAGAPYPPERSRTLSRSNLVGQKSPMPLCGECFPIAKYSGERSCGTVRPFGVGGNIRSSSKSRMLFHSCSIASIMETRRWRRKRRRRLRRALPPRARLTIRSELLSPNIIVTI